MPDSVKQSAPSSLLVARYVLGEVGGYLLKPLKVSAILGVIFAAPSALIWLWMSFSGQPIWDRVWSLGTLTRPQVGENAVEWLFGVGLLSFMLRIAFDLVSYAPS